MPAAVLLEQGRKRVFASVLGWEGWCRSGRDETAALEALAAYAPRYRVIVERAGLDLALECSFRVVERLAGNATTDFGAPGAVAVAERRGDTAAAGARRRALLQAAWDHLDEVVERAPAELRKGPRGGGRDRDAIASHVVEAEVAYARKLGVREEDPATRRSLLLEHLSLPSSPQGESATGWPLAYGARRIIWHVLDHAWEIEDRSA